MLSFLKLSLQDIVIDLNFWSFGIFFNQVVNPFLEFLRSSLLNTTTMSFKEILSITSFTFSIYWVSIESGDRTIIIL